MNNCFQFLQQLVSGTEVVAKLVVLGVFDVNMSTGVQGNVLHFSGLFSYPQLLFCLIISLP